MKDMMAYYYYRIARVRVYVDLFVYIVRLGSIPLHIVAPIYGRINQCIQYLVGSRAA